MTQLVLNIEQPAVLPILKKLISIIDGVSIAKPKRKAKTGLELAMEDVRAGRINRYNSSEELFEKLGI